MNKMKFSKTFLQLVYLVGTSVTAETDVTSFLNSNDTERNTRGRIIGGTPVDPGEYPWFALLNGGGCGGSLVSPEYILTAAHCLNDSIHGKVTIGKYCRNKKNCEASFEKIPVRERGVYIHPDYKANPISMDFMLLRLKKRSTLTPVEMDLSAISDNYKPGRDNLWTIGMGHVEPGYVAFKLEHLELKYVNNDACDLAYEEDDWAIHDNMMCAINDDVTKQACYGDSGGPLFDRRENKLVGITSWGDSDCTSKMVVYSRIADQIDWIKTIICGKHTLPIPAFCTPTEQPSSTPSEVESVTPSSVPSISSQPSQSSYPSSMPSLSLAPSAAPLPQSTYFQIVAKTVSDTKLCIQAGNMTTLQECNSDNESQLWRADSSGQLRVFENEDMCLQLHKRDQSTRENLKLGLCYDENSVMGAIFIFNSFQNSLLWVKSNVDWQTYGLKAVSGATNSTNALVTMEWHRYGDFTTNFIQQWDLEYPAITVSLR